MNQHPSSLSLYGIVLLPPAVFVLLGTSSMSAGAAIAALLVLFTHPSAVLRVVQRHALAIFSFILVIFAIFTHLSIAAVFGDVSFIRSVLSLVLLAVLGLSALVFARVLCEMESQRLNRSVAWLFGLLSFALLIGIFELIPGSLFGKYKLVFPFAEPSHFSLAYAPFLLYFVTRSSSRHRLPLLFIAFVLAYLLHNLTLLLACLLIAAVSLRTGLLILLAALVALGGLAVDTTYFAARVVIGGENDNLSSLVYLQGWQLIPESLTRSWLVGLGFQQLGEAPTAVEAAEIIYAVSGLEMNRTDGGFLGAKLMSEFGVLGVILVVMLLCSAWVSGAHLRLHSSSQDYTSPSATVFCHCVMACAPVEILVRGTGYFSGTTLLLMVAMWYLWVLNPERHAARGLSRQQAASFATTMNRSLA